MNRAAQTAIPLLLSAFMASTASADVVGDEGYEYPGCADDRGEPAVYMSRNAEAAEAATKGRLSVPYAAARYLDRANMTRPAILYNESYMDGISPVLRDFTFSHECFHIKSGDARHAYLQIFSDEGNGYTREDHVEVERRANCYAAHDLRDVYGYRVEDLEVLESDMRDRMSSYHARDTMPLIRSCFANRQPRPE